MREYGQIQSAFWTNPDIQGLSSEEKLLAVYLLTGPHSNGLGCYRLPDGYVQADFGWSLETVSKGFAELFRIGFSERCETTFFVVIPKFLKWNPITNQNVASARMKEFETIPKNTSIYPTLCRSVLEYGKHLPNPFINRLETLTKGYGKQDPTQPNQEKTGKESPLSEKKFSDDDLQIASWMFDCLKTRNPEHKSPNLEKWANSIRLIRERDGRKPEHIRALFEWAHNDSFWGANILSPDKLREKWDQLVIKRNAAREKAAEDWQEKARRLSLQARDGESWGDFKARVQMA